MDNICSVELISAGECDGIIVFNFHVYSANEGEDNRKLLFAFDVDQYRRPYDNYYKEHHIDRMASLNPNTIDYLFELADKYMVWDIAEDYAQSILDGMNEAKELINGN